MNKLNLGAKSYVVMFTASFAERQQVQDFLDSVEEVTYWYACLPYCIFFTARLEADDLAKRLMTRFGTVNGSFIVMEASTNRQGWMPQAAWHLLANPNNPRLPEPQQ